MKIDSEKQNRNGGVETHTHIHIYTYIHNKMTDRDETIAYTAALNLFNI
jgi:hypothetical protein